MADAVAKGAGAGSAVARSKPLAWLQPAVLVGSLVPMAFILGRIATRSLGPDPIATLLNQLGLLGLLLLFASLACTPLKVVLGWTWPMRLRKTLGLTAFFTLLAHFLVYVVLDQSLMLGALLRDVAKRPFIAVGFFALLLLVPVALTSTKNSPKKLGFARWKLLHRLVYVVGILAVIHFTLRVKADATEPFLYGAVLFAFLAVRGVARLRGQKI